jgi:molybdopterin-guanine dinucleotide biosynthesis protein A
VIGAIIAGGSSTRLGGTPKGLLNVGGVRIIDRVANALLGVTGDVILVANSADAETWLPSPPGIPVVADVRPERGSLVGIHTALSGGKRDVMVVAWDMPFVTTRLLELIRERGRVERFATVPEGARGLEPFCALYTSACLPFIESALDAGDLRMSSALDRLPTMTRVSRGEIETIGDPTRLFFNVNTAQDLESAEQMAFTSS